MSASWTACRQSVVEVVTESELPTDTHTRIVIGETKTALNSKIDPTSLGREVYVLRSIGNDLLIVGHEDGADPLSQRNSNVGTLWGVYDFLENVMEVRWLWPGHLGTYVPKTKTIQFASIDRTNAPALRFRELGWWRTRQFIDGRGKLNPQDAQLGFSSEVLQDYSKELSVFLRRHRMGGMDTKLPSGHRFHGWWNRYGKDHPNWFALRKDGTRGHPDPNEAGVPMCVTNEELQDFIVTQWDGESVIELGPVDSPGRCLCDRCRAWDGHQPKTVPWFAQMVFQTDFRAQNLFPGATSDRYARFWKTIQQKAARRNPQVVVSGSFIYENEFPAPTRDIELGQMTIQEIRREYFSGFGPAADNVRRYWDYWEDYAKDNMMRFLKLFRDLPFRYRTYPLAAHKAFPPQCFAPAQSRLAEAMTAAREAPSPEYAERVRFLQIGLEHARLTVDLAAEFDGQFQVSEQRFTDTQQALEKLVHFRKKHQRTYFSDLLWVTSYWERPLWDLGTMYSITQPVADSM